MRELVEAYKEQSPHIIKEKKVKKALADMKERVKRVTRGFNWESLEELQMNNPQPQFIYNPCAEIIQRSIQEELNDTIEKYLYEPYNEMLVRTMNADVQSVLLSHNRTGIVRIDPTDEHTLAISVELEEQSPLTNMSIVHNIGIEEEKENAPENAQNAPQQEISDSEDIRKGKSLVQAYNERYGIRSPIVISERFIANRLVIEESDTLEYAYDLMGEYQRRVSEEIARAADREIMDSLNMTRPGLYFRELYMRVMPLTLREPQMFTLTINNLSEPIYMSGSGFPVGFSVQRSNHVDSSFGNMRGILSTGQNAARPLGMKQDRYIRMGRDGDLYTYSIMYDRYERFVVNDNENYETWELIHLPEDRQWFRMSIDGGRPIIVDID